MMSAYYSKENQNVMVVVKGAPEFIIPRCIYQYDALFQPQNFQGSYNQGQEYLADVSYKLAKEGLKPVTIACKTMDYSHFESEESQH
jgi:magnesium-transporting ATPase (P-type)